MAAIKRGRLIAKYLGRRLGKEVEVVNRTGAIVRNAAIADAAPDGQTIGQISGEIGMMYWHGGLTTLQPGEEDDVQFREVIAALGSGLRAASDLH